MAASVAIQGAKYPLALDDFFQSRHHRDRRFFFHQLRVIDLAAGIIQNDDQVIPALILEPAMPAAIDVQQHTRQRTPRSAFAMHPAFAPPFYQPGSLQAQFHSCVAQFNLVLCAQLLMKMPHVQIEILLPIESQNLLHQGQGDSLGRGLPPPSIEQPVIAELFIALAPATHVPVANADDLRCLPPRDPFRHRPQDYFLYSHCPLHRGECLSSQRSPSCMTQRWPRFTAASGWVVTSMISCGFPLTAWSSAYWMWPAVLKTTTPSSPLPSIHFVLWHPSYLRRRTSTKRML